MNLEQAFKLLQVHGNISPGDLQIQYRLLAIKFHPDKNKDENATMLMAQINQAYELIKKYIEQKEMPSKIIIQAYYPNSNWGQGTATSASSWTFTMSSS